MVATYPTRCGTTHGDTGINFPEQVGMFLNKEVPFELSMKNFMLKRRFRVKFVLRLPYARWSNTA
jgi:hypothetical protein